MSTNPASTPQQTPNWGTTPCNTTEILADTKLQTPVITILTPTLTTDVSSPDPSHPTSPAQTSNGSEVSPPPHTPPMQTALSELDILPPSHCALPAQPTLDDLEVSLPPSSCCALPTQLTLDDSEKSLSPSCCASPTQVTLDDNSEISSSLPSSVYPPASQAQGWTPTHKLSWLLGPQHDNYIHAATPYLIGVPGGPGWEKLLVSFITFKSLSSSQPVSTLCY